MKTDKKTIDRLLEKYHNGQTTLVEEEILRTWCTDPENAAVYPDMAEIFQMYHTIGQMEPEHLSDEQNPDPEKPQPVERSAQKSMPHTGYVRIQWIYGIAAGFFLIVFGLAAGLLIANQAFVSEEYLSALQSDVREMKEIVALSKIQNASPSERILAVHEMKSLDRADDEVINALINAMQNDPQVNVRMAAAEALFEFGNTEKVRRAMIKTLNAQDAPLLQIKLIDMLVQLKEKRALPELQRVMEDEREIQAVRDQAAQGMAILL